MPPNHKLKNCTARYKLRNSQEKIYHLIYRDDIKLFVKNERQLETLTQAERIYTEEIGMEFDIEKCAIRDIRSKK